MNDQDLQVLNGLLQIYDRGDIKEHYHNYLKNDYIKWLDFFEFLINNVEPEALYNRIPKALKDQERKIASDFSILYTVFLSKVHDHKVSKDKIYMFRDALFDNIIRRYQRKH